MFPRTLLARTGLMISIMLISFVLLAGSVLWFYIMKPLAQHAAENLAALVGLSVTTLDYLPASTQRAYIQQLRKQQHLNIQFHIPAKLINHNTSDRSLSPNSELEFHSAFFAFFKQSIKHYIKYPISIYLPDTGEKYIWIEIRRKEHPLWVGFAHSLIGPNPPLALFLILVSAGLLIVISSLFFVSYLNRPLKKLLLATQNLRHGKAEQILQQTGPLELQQLTKSFNQMNCEIQQLLQNRTVLLSGISHDLRTPISRAKLALEMMAQTNVADSRLMSSLEKDLDEMNQLIQRTLEFARGLNTDEQQSEHIEINSYLKNYCLHHPYHSLLEFFAADKTCHLYINTHALNRVMDNLLENALRYSQFQKVSILLQLSKDNISIHIRDQGGGVCDDKIQQLFQPFFRLESSRNNNSGGSGLGLSIVKQLCQSQHWQIQLKNYSLQCTDSSTDSRGIIGLEAIVTINLQETR